MRTLFPLPVLGDLTGEIIGLIPPRTGMMTSLGTIVHMEGPRSFVFSDSFGVRARHAQARPWVEEEEALRWGFFQDHEAWVTLLEFPVGNGGMKQLEPWRHDGGCGEPGDGVMAAPAERVSSQDPGLGKR